MNILIVTIKSWNVSNAYKMKKNFHNYNIEIIDSPTDLCIEFINSFNPDYIFFPHWSWNISEEIYKHHKCIVFHMTDLPFGRGGSPLQNLIDREIENTKISAISVNESIDSGDIYMKTDLNLNGSANEIFIRASKIIFNEMIPTIIKDDITPIKQSGKSIPFKRRKPYQSEINDSDESLNKIYDKIRMLDGEGYPKAYIIIGNNKFEFSRAQYNDSSIIADVKITEVTDE